MKYSYLLRTSKESPSSNCQRIIEAYFLDVNCICYGSKKIYIGHFHEDNRIKRLFKISEQSFKNMNLYKDNTRLKAFHLLGYDIDNLIFIRNDTQNTKEARLLLGIDDYDMLKDINNKISHLTKLEFKGFNENTLNQINDEGTKAKNTFFIMPFTQKHSLNLRIFDDIFKDEEQRNAFIYQLEACDSHLDDYDLDYSLANNAIPEYKAEYDTPEV